MRNRGKAKYFHGRKEELDLFRGTLNIAKIENGGTIFIIQGSPGVGKSALLEEFKELGVAEEWGVVEISHDGLWDAHELRKYLHKDYTIKLKELKAGASAYGLGMEGVFSINEKSVLQILESSKKPLLLMLDEGQHLADVLNADFQIFKDTKKVLDNIHNNKFRVPLVFVISGLGMTKKIIQNFGVSILDDKSIVNLEKLDKLSEQEILKDWIYQEGGLDQTIQSKLWIEKITEFTHGWPHHINAYGRSASEWIKKHPNKLTMEGLNWVLKDGEQKRFDYYDERFDTLTLKETELITELLIVHRNVDEFRDESIIDFFKEKTSLEEAEKLFDRTVEKGVFHRQKNKKYSVAVPSMRTWLIDQFGQDL
ncbi:MAG: ATP-binding protein [Flavobacteriaceae bacterium]|nr:ATP-binding protein [Flavobacteriaceae bacterium]MCY4266723.1 ATP-binding protein [Flavobacteriaceae bacterium]MCY4297736.1 ATP-binding protein [Flavobacteriaceae bacterium]